MTTAARYDIHIDPVTSQDAGVYTCVDDAGLGPRASAVLSVLHPTSASQSSPSASLTSCGSGPATSQLPVANHTEGACVAYTQDCQLHKVKYSARKLRGARSMQRSGVRPSVRPSVCLSVCPRVVASTQSCKYQYKYQYLSLKYQYQYQYPVL